MTTLGTIGQLSHLVAVVAFALLAMALMVRRLSSGLALAVALASLVTAFWAGAVVLAARYGADALPSLSALETLRTAAWIAVLLVVQRRALGLADRPTSSFAVAVGLGFVMALQLALDLMFGVGDGLAGAGGLEGAGVLLVATRIIVAISGLVLLHNLYVNGSASHGIALRLFAVGLGLLFAYDLNLYTLQFLLGRTNIDLLGLRGAVDALVAPLLYLALREGRGGRLHLSRAAAFHTVSFSVIGLYLIAMSLLAYGLRLTGGDWGQLLQVTFLAVTLIAGAMVVLSPRFRAELKVRIARNFYRYRYDYRVEWLRFIEKLDQGDVTGGVPFRERLVEAIAAVLDCRGGALLERQDAPAFEVTANWRWPDLTLPPIAESSAVVQFLEESGRIIDFERLRADTAGEAPAGSHGTLTLPAWAAGEESPWLAVPLVHRDRLTAILLLRQSLAPRDLNWEDYDLLRTLARQGASYLAEAETQGRLDEAQRFEEYNRRFAFVMHDVKNLVSQLGLVTRNAERHADNPEYRADMVATLKSSVAKMTDLLKLMGREAPGVSAPDMAGEADIARILSLVVASVRRQHGAIELEGADEPMIVPGDPARLEAMLTHLVQNAIDASTPDGPIRLALACSPADVRISITDSGHGMSAAFVRDELFRPFRSTKDGGFGIGAFEAREIARAHGGRMEVTSRPGEGSCFMVTLPARRAGAPAPLRHAVRA
jgi:putative PEP-CTERM system histidine kinase